MARPTFLKDNMSDSEDKQDEDIDDPSVVNLAAEVADSSDIAVIPHLLKLKTILDNAKGAKLAKVKKDIWSYDLLHLLILAMKQDFNVVSGGMKTAETLIYILSKTCTGLYPSDTQEYYGVFLPDAVTQVLSLARKCQVKYMKTASVMEETKMGYLENFKSMLESLWLVLGSHPFIALNILNSVWIQQMLMSDDVQTVSIVLTTLQSAVRMKSGVLDTVGPKIVENIMDEMIYKLSTTENVELASAVTRTLLLFCDYQPSMIEFLSSRYKGLRPLLNKWQGKGFGRDLRRLILLLESGNAREAAVKKLSQAASVIQAAWKAHYTRKRLKKANKAISVFQRSFRVKKEDSQARKERIKEETELKHFLLLQRRQAMRDLHSKRLEALKILPARDVQKYLEDESHTSAVLIQKTWRGFNARQEISKKKLAVKRQKACITIQRAARKFMERRLAQKNEPPSWQRPPGLTDARRVELQEQITEWRENHIVQAKTEADQKLLHEKVQSLLRQHVVNSRNTRRKQLQREALIGRVELDSSLLLDSPKLSDVTLLDLSNFTSHSIPIASKARQNHSEELRKTHQPWFRRLKDMDSEDNYLEEFKDF